MKLQEWFRKHFLQRHAEQRLLEERTERLYLRILDLENKELIRSRRKTREKEELDRQIRRRKNGFIV